MGDVAVAYKRGSCERMRIFLLIPAFLALCSVTNGYPTMPTSNVSKAPSCAQAGKADLCKIACESTCRDFPPGFKAAGCALQQYCTKTPKWAEGSVCMCSPTPPTPPTPPPPAPNGTTTTSYDPVYDVKTTSTNKVACSDGSHGLAGKYPTFGSLPGFPLIGGVSQIAGWNSENCGTCWKLTFNGTSIHMLAIDHADAGRQKGDAVNLSKEAMDKLTNGQATKLGRVQSTVVEVDKSVCGY